jgi:hypothetical protein
MSDERENQALDALLGVVAGCDRHLAPSSRVEQGVMAYWDATAGAIQGAAAKAPATADTAPGANRSIDGAAIRSCEVARSGRALLPGPGHRRLVPALGAAAGVALALFVGWGSRSSEETARPGVVTARVGSRDTRAAAVAPDERRASAPVVSDAGGGEVPARPVEPRRPSDRDGGAPRGVDETRFVPLMPLGAHDLSGPLQLVRVRMRPSALAGLGVPIDMRRLSDPVHADVLLGEDGMARAIRIASEIDVRRER